MSCNHLLKVFVLAGLGVIVLSNCAGVRRLDRGTNIPAVEADNVERLVLLPPVDATIREGKKVDFDSAARKAARRYCKKLKLTLIEAENGPDRDAADVDALRDAAPEWVRSLGPDGERWMLLLVADDVTSKLVFGSTGNAEISAYLLDRDSGSIAWCAKGVGRVGMGGLAGMMFKGLMASDALNAAIGNALTQMPHRVPRDRTGISCSL